MQTTVSDEQVATYQRDGFTVIRNFLDQAEVQRLLDEVQTAALSLGKQKVAGGSHENVEEGDGFYDRVFLQRLNLWKINAYIRDLFLDPALGQLLCRLEGVDGMRMWHDQTLQKAPWANATAYHIDNPYWSFYSQHSISIWIALDEATLENGCLSYLPGSHKVCSYDRSNAIGMDFGHFFENYPELATTQPTYVPMQPGDAGFHNGLTGHGAGPNNTPGWRRAMTCAYMPVGSTFNGQANVLPPDYLATLSIGDELNNEAQNPLIWQKT